jgi:alkanesulfonate monooxygenase SsuD/methylene tetrahydromethanopterin reductase-like flavin-dependent oxidoreductase (luciferase family)
MIEIVGKLLSGKMVEHHGEFYDFPAVQMAPAPSRRVEVRIGGHTPMAYRRAARHDGWLGVTYPPQELAGIIRQIQEERRRAGTLDRPFDLMIAHYPSSPDAGEYEEYARLGVTSVNVPPWWYRREHAPTLDDKRRSMEQFARRYVAPLGS